MYNQLSNFPYSRAFVTQPFTAGVEFTEEEADRITALFGRDELRRADIDQGRIDDQVRISNVKFYYPSEETFWIFDKLNQILTLNNEHVWNFDLNGYESFQYAEYDAKDGGKYDFHADLDYSNREKSTDLQTRKLSLSLILNRPGIDFEGGDFEVMIGDRPVACPQAKGMVLVFPSWVMHRVTPVTRGVRKSIVVWVTGPKFR